ncbi:hypothetical protein Bca52824_018842 [Brassica carinata]|uniref:Reverse transcriptase zinc-binding domain-containing protein n=1 Tax=Brassica carinata TaxID=52824 RepID=A0A8X7VRS2_BRACI|nr:hypothetical protein Bca52824_018842 [Brassica carinata]
MASNLDKALLDLSLEEDDEPYVLPDKPEYFSTERNSLSLIGRLLNPQCQKMSDLILEMPRKWQLYDRGIGSGVVSVSSQSSKTEVVKSMDPEDPLYGLIPSSLMGIDVVSGKPKIAEELLDNMRIYIKSSEGQEKLAREERVKKSLRDLEDDSIGQQTLLRLGPAPIISKDLDKGKGVVFDFIAKKDRTPTANKLMASAICAGAKGSTGYSIGVHGTSVSGTPLKKTNKRRRPGTFKRKANGKGLEKISAKPGKKIGEGNNVNISFKFVDKYLLDFGVRMGGEAFFVSCIYGEPMKKNRPKLWERLSRIGVHRKEAWCMLGDFNDIRNNGEKIGGPRLGEKTFQPFNDMLSACQMVELPSSGNNLTWGGLRCLKWIQSRLDRCFGNKNWLSLFPVSNQVFLDKRGSDHRPVLVKLLASADSYRGNFKFDGRFLNKPGVKEEIKKAWLTNHTFFGSSVSEKLKRCRKSLSRWKKKSDLNSRDKIIQIQVALESEQSSSFPSGVRVNYLKQELIKAYKEEEKYWRQRSKDKWAVKGDLNTRYYHASVKTRRARMRIEKLMDEKGQTQFSEAAKAQVATDYFNKLFTSEGDGNFDQLFHGFSARGLIQMLESAVCNNKIQGIKFSDVGPMIHHMLFADDSLLICRADEEQARELMRILKIYERATGQMVSIAKSAVTFGSRVPEATKETIKRATGIHKEGGTGSYLGLPECFSGSKIEMLAYIYDRLKDRLSIFKSRYFPHGEFLSAKNGPRPSYAWRSIQFGKELLVLGITKKIGNGRTVSVWVDAWIEGEVMRRPLMKNIFVDLLLCVDKLIDQETRCWNLNTLHDLFYEEDVARIVAMKPVFEEEDFWVWKYNKHGGYSAKSGYWLKNRLTRSDEIREAEALPSLNVLKTEAWKLKAPPKIKTFFWRALSNAISAGELLVKRGIKMDPCCQACGFQGESINHILFTCPVARQVWALANVPSPRNGFDEVSHYSNFHFLFSLTCNKMCSHQVVNAMPWLVWFLWKNRNSLLFDGKQANLLELVAKTFEEAEMWSLAQINEQREEEEERADLMKQAKRWSPPPRGWLKCNIGVDWMRSTHKGGGAWVIRDHNGKVLIHSRRAFSQIKNLHEAKLDSLLWSIESISAHHLKRVIFAIDDGDLTGMILRPKAWPNFKRESSRILNKFGSIDGWRLVKEERANNRGAFLIAQSVTRDGRVRSYVATGSPS